MGSEIIVILTALGIYAAGAIAPGPSFALIVRLSASGSRAAALGAIWGLSLGAASYATLAMSGFAFVVTRVGWLMTAVQLAGGCYLIWLGLSAWLSPVAPPADLAGCGRARGFWCGLRTGLLVELANPKSVAFFISIFAVAIPADAALWTKAAILGGGFALDMAWYGFAASLLLTAPAQRVYRRFQAGIERALGVVLAGFGCRMITEKLG